LPSYGDEGVPQGIMQAMACGLAVISTPIGAIAEAVEDGVTGMLVAPKEAAALGAALQQLLGDAALRTRMGKAGQARAHQQFGIEQMVQRMEAIFFAASAIAPHHS
jgi:glycosyltransferase involved in cell wall biosynthesis